MSGPKDITQNGTTRHMQVMNIITTAFYSFRHSDLLVIFAVYGVETTTTSFGKPAF